MHTKQYLTTTGPRILYINPAIPNSFWGFLLAMIFGRLFGWGWKAPFPPNGLITAAAHTPSDWPTRLVDMQVEPLRAKDIRWADFVFITGMMVQSGSMRKVLEWCKSLNTPTLVGGPFASSCPDAPELSSATSIFIGEMEDPEVRFELEQDLLAGNLKARYRGKRVSLKESPIPRYDLLKPGAYAAWSMQISRGCPYTCEFCDIPVLYGNVPRYKTDAQIHEMLDAMFASGWRSNIFIVDDNFIGNHNEAIRVVKALIEWQKKHKKPPFNFYTEADISLGRDLPKSNLLRKLMFKAGFFAVFVGIETPSAEALKETRKIQNTGIDLIECIERLRKDGLMVWAGFITGFDSDDEGSFDRLYEFIKKAKISFAMAGMLTAIPNTPLWKRLEAEGRLLLGGTGDQFKVSNFVPAQMARSELARGHRGLLMKLFDPEAFFDRAGGELEEWNSGEARAVSWREVLLAVPKSLFIQGVLSSYRRHYWRFLWRIAKNSLAKLPRAFASAIYGHHFIRYTQDEVIPELIEAEQRLAQEEAEQRLAKGATPTPRKQLPLAVETSPLT